ncbi:MAG: molybdopterin-dependent oxidoreductase, partial [Dehalococcoidia bacterium]|nr:molybdopterin-dependent oxidoreductase [Dehalococcoidia bacterium]
MPFLVRDQIALNLAIPKEKVRVIGTPLGGGFGGKCDITIEILLALGALRTGRPVKMTLTRPESLRMSSKRHAFDMHFKIGATQEGRFTALQAHLVSDAGAYAGLSAAIMEQAIIFAGGPYVWPNVEVEGYAVYTNNVVGGAFRGFGINQVAFALESCLDELARRLALDPFELRLRNALEVGSVTITGERLKASVAIKETLRQAQAALKKTAPIVTNRRLGIGVAAGYKNVGSGRGNVNFAGAVVELQENGTLLVRASAVDLGQGVRTVLSQIAAEVTGIDYDRIEIITGDTALIPPGAGALGQRQTFVAGNAVLRASQEFRGAVVGYVARQYGLPAEGLIIQGDRIVHKDRGTLLTLGELARLALSEGDALRGAYEYHAPPTYPIIGDTEATQPVLRDGRSLLAHDTISSRFARPGTPVEVEEMMLEFDPEEYRNYFAYDYTTQVALVDVDEQTGETRLLRLISAHDAGRVLNAQKVKGQLESSAVMGMGYALSEEFVMRGGV